ncbi:GlpG protein (membrane protein of glp regulon) [Lactiplantibacillus plantarum]|uniref:rhomboid family intramembrane serine protease n=1 Tax=Lactiplantibacillus plantarum TaxID=1590 RepID=UPI0021AA90A3|nr:rhomboid family intramembrane serine protease [Lactiplantibacillus plantarum]MCT4440121.1 rhomboid family intramembrane serine protease [Lactiplantibacillus plantarum]
MMRIKRWWQTEPAITQVLLGITVAVFLVEWLMGDGAMLIFNSLGAKNNQAIAAGQWWRLVTPMFLHMGLTHIALNGVVIYFMGMQIEAMYGHWRMLAIYILGGISGNIMSFALSNNQSVGASTACFALFGAFLTIGESFWENPVIRQLTNQFLLLTVLNLVFDMFSNGIDIWGHVGGLVGGFLLGYLLGVPRIGKIAPLKRIVATVILVIGWLALLKIGFTNANLTV